MAQSLLYGKRVTDRLRSQMTPEEVAKRLRPRLPEDVPLPPRLPAGNDASQHGIDVRRAVLRDGYGYNPDLLDQPLPSSEQLQGNIENLIGFIQLPLGAIGPLRVNGLHAHGDYIVPMATTEGALIASYHRGAYVLSQSGGAEVICMSETVARAPGFVFANLTQAAFFMDWIVNHAETFRDAVAETTRHGELLDIKLSSCGCLVYLIFEYETGDAAGQNMVTIATDNVCRKIVEMSPVKPLRWYVEANLSGDKKASMQSFLSVRGKKVVASAQLPNRLIQKFLHTTAFEMAEQCRVASLGAMQSGTIGAQAHYANALAAMFMACGQDVACVAEAAVGITTMTVTDDGLQVSVTMPNLVVGTVGGGTHLPSARACLQMLDCAGAGKARAFAEICAATALAGEISIVAAMSAGHFTRAHTYHRHKLEKPS